MVKWLPSLKGLRAFEATVRLKSFSAAAKELAVTPAAVHQLVHKLEDSLATKLIQKNGNEVTASKIGKVAASEITAGFDQIQSAVNYIRHQKVFDQLTMTVEPSFATFWLFPNLHELKKQMSDLQILVETTDTFRDLHFSEVDLAIRYVKRRTLNAGEFKLFDDETIVICGTPTSKGRDNLQPEDLVQKPLIHFNPTTSCRVQPSWPEWFQHYGLPYKEGPRDIFLSDYVATINAAIGGHGYALVSSILVKKLIEEKILVTPVTNVMKATHQYIFVINQRSTKQDILLEIAEKIKTLQ